MYADSLLMAVTSLTLVSQLCIVLQQKKNAMESIIPYQVLPYDFYIGFYLYDAEVEHLKGQTNKWKNAMEGMYSLLLPERVLTILPVLYHTSLDGTLMRQYTIIPTTFKAKEETSLRSLCTLMRRG